MRIGVMIGSEKNCVNYLHAFDGDSMDDVIAKIKRVEDAGLDDAWFPNTFSFDAISTLALAGRETSRIGLGTAVTPTYPRHPTAIAQQALTTAIASSNRFTLGIGLSHKIVIEDMLGMSFDKPAKHMREYLNVLLPLMRGETVNYDGEQYRVHDFALNMPGVENVPVVIAALGPTMLKIAGEVADGTSTWAVGIKTMEEHIVPGLGSGDHSIVAGLPVVLTNNTDAARETIARGHAVGGRLPSYRAMLDKEGAAGPADIAIIGDEDTLRREIKRFEEVGVTHLNAAIMPVEDGAYSRTLEFLSDLTHS